ncbi:ATP-dependent nuclease subunit B [Lactococcus ileimucosae]|uniref:ATP-dependent nuclease subunit B n=1 Tax=Lactococcus ileimucosae TaxID=2941329 RepID=UPI002043DE25|nr:ATP-dependent nuclease subunit B [Lactococcus ileimucosae]
MEIIYTEITQDLTAFLLERAQKALREGKKVYYIVPSSMSFEKEKEILERISSGEDTAVFDLLVTRFKQLPYYFDRKDITLQGKVELTQSGLSMLFRKVLKSFSKEELPFYYSLQASPAFLEMLVNLRTELITANLSFEDLPESPKNVELSAILHRFEEELSASYANFSEFQDFTQNILEGKFTQDLQNVVLIIDGYTRFNAEEESFIAAIQEKVSEIIIGTYASEVDYKLTDFSLSVYKNSLEMLERFQNKFSAKIKYVYSPKSKTVYDKLTDLLKMETNFLQENVKIELNRQDKRHFEIWETENQMAEIEAVAKEIRQKITRGASFKEFTVLVGDVDTYAIPLQETFELYEIPFFYAREESMSQHPLIIFLESLYAIKKNNYRTNDVVNLLKSNIYRDVNFDQESLDYFEYYVNKYKIRGKKKFVNSFDASEFLEIDKVESLRETLFGENSALQVFLKDNSEKTGNAWLNSFQSFLQKGHILENMNSLYTQAEHENNHVLADKHEQVWKLLLSNLMEFQSIFSEQKMKVLEFLDLILSGLKNAKYRQIPANVDVVNVKDYELVEARTNKYIYAIGLSLTNFPKVKKNSSLLSDEERASINQNVSHDDFRFIEQLNVTNSSKNTFTSLSLLNAATDKLVLSRPQIYANVQDEISPLLQLFIKHTKAGENIKREISSVNLLETVEHIGNKRSLISNIGKIEHLLAQEEEKVENDKRNFWSSLFRILVKESSDFQNLIHNLDQDIAPVALSPDTVKEVYSDEIYASVSSFERFYNCEYQYFLEKTLNLEVFENIDLNSKVVGNFFHEVFEKLLLTPSLTNENFDQHLERVLQEVDNNYARYFTQDATAQFTWTNLGEIVRQTAVILKKGLENSQIKTLATESAFGFPHSELGEFTIDKISLRGRIDRIDQFFENSVGAVDYKSSQHKFDLVSAYDGTSLQFLTYLDVLKQTTENQKLWGALYLQLKNESINLSDVDALGEISALLSKNMRYEGLIFEEYRDNISEEINLVNINRNNVYSEREFESLLKLNKEHYIRAGQRIREGEIAINPVMTKEGIDKAGNVHGCRYCPLKSICRFEANRHMKDYTREVGQKSRKEILDELKGEKAND